MKKGKILIATSSDKSDEFLYGKGYLYLNESKFIQAPKISDAINYLIDVETKRDIKLIWHHIDNSISVGDTIHKSTGAEIKIVKIDENNYYYTAHALMGTHSVDKKMIDDRIKSGTWKVKHTYAKGTTITGNGITHNDFFAIKENPKNYQVILLRNFKIHNDDKNGKFFISEILKIDNLKNKIQAFSNKKTKVVFTHLDENENITNTTWFTSDLKEAINNNQYAKQNKYDNGGVIPNNYDGKSAKNIWNGWSKEQRVHFLKDHPVEAVNSYNESYTDYFNADELKKYSESDYADLPQDIKNNIFYHTDEGQYKKGSTIKMKKNIEFRKLSKSGNFDIIVPEGRYEIEVSKNGAEIVNVINPTGTRIKYTHSTIHQKYGNEIANYFYGDKYKKGSTIKGAGANGKYLDSVSADKKTQILRNIANHYGVSLAEAEQEVKDADAEMLYEYITNNALRLEVYNDFESKKYKKGSTIDSFGTNYNVVFEKPNSDIAWKKTINANSIKEAKKIFLKEHPTCTILNIGESYKKGSTIKSCNCEYSIGGL